MEPKAYMRQKFLALRDALPKEIALSKSQAISQKLFKSDDFYYCKTLFTYFSFKQEVSTLEIVDHSLKAGKKVALPFICGSGGMVFIEIKDTKDLVANKYGVMEPVYNEKMVSSADSSTLVITPGIVFDRQNHRVGYGKGYYDKFFANNTKVKKIGLAYDFQVTDEIDISDFDVALDYLITG